MKTIFKSLLTCALLLSFAPSAHAGLHVEPFLGYLMGETDSSPSVDVTGIDMGARVGFTTMMFAVGGELSKSNLEMDTSPSVDIEPTNMGIFAAFEFPVLVRAYATYILSSKADVGIAEYKGEGYRLGVGFTGLPFVAINLEYLHLAFDEASAGGITVDPNLDLNFYGINVSLPLDLL